MAAYIQTELTRNYDQVTDRSYECNDYASNWQT